MSAAIQIIDPLYEMHGFSLSDFKVLTLCLVFSSLIMMYLRHSFLHLLYSDFAELLKTIMYVFVQRWEVFGYYFFKYFSCPILSFLSSGTFRLRYCFTCPWGSVNFILLCFFSLFFRLEIFYSSPFKFTDFFSLSFHSHSEPIPWLFSF